MTYLSHRAATSWGWDSIASADKPYCHGPTMFASSTSVLRLPVAVRLRPGRKVGELDQRLKGTNREHEDIPWCASRPHYRRPVLGLWPPCSIPSSIVVLVEWCIATYFDVWSVWCCNEAHHCTDTVPAWGQAVFCSKQPSFSLGVSQASRKGLQFPGLIAVD